MIINNAINSPFPTSLSLGGTNSALTASNGGILYSTASSGNILPGTSTANKLLMSGASGAPSWSSATYPEPTTTNQILYSSSDNVVDVLPTVNKSVLVSDESGSPVWLPLMSDGQLIIGANGAQPIASNLTAGDNVIITNSSNGVTISSRPRNWVWIETQTADTPYSSFSFYNVFSTDFVAYRLVLQNILPTDLHDCLILRFGIGTTFPPTYISSGYLYKYQLCCIGNSGTENVYHGYTGIGGGANEANLTITDINGVNNDPTYGGVSGYIDLFVVAGSSNFAGGVSRLGYIVSNTLAFYNSTCSFQISSDTYTSVLLQFRNSGNSIQVGSTATLYGLATNNVF